ncbi:MAG TPA: hypothetical protein PLB91_10465 [Spirochaetales bacterium]|nr:hypothetical protein [Spirochaetales bacterium]HRY53592.1 hypothetical protein [Spirochaetia bacterium]
MLESLELAPLLLAPVAALLFLSFLRSRKLSYPHELLDPEARRGRASLLPRSFRGRYDILADAAIALALALALPSSTPVAGPRGAGGGSALVLDCSLSMLRGEPGSRPLDLALERLLSAAATGAEGEAEAFALAFDPGLARTRLYPLAELSPSYASRRPGAKAAAGAGRIAEELEARLCFFALDYRALAELGRRGFGSIVLLTDSLGRRAEGIGLVELGFGPGPSAYPSAARYDRASGAWVAALAEAGPRGEVLAFSLDPASGRLSDLPPSRYAIEERPAGRILRFAEAGFYVVALRGPEPGQGADLAFRFSPATIACAASGPFSERMASVFPFLERAGAASLALADLGYPRPRAARSLVSAILPEDGGLLLDPALSGGRPVAAGLAPGADFALGPSSLANEDLALAYYNAIASLGRPAFLAWPELGSGPRGGVPRLSRLGSILLAHGPEGPEPLLPPAAESFEPRGGPPLSIAPAAPRRWPWALLLAALAAAKLSAWALLSRRRSPI